MNLRGVVAVATALHALLAPRPAHAWQEAHETADDAEIRIDPDGQATVRHLFRWRIVHGPLKWVDLVGVGAGAALKPDVGAHAEDGRELQAHLARLDDNSVRVVIDEPHPPTRGAVTLDVQWRIDLVASRALARDGAMWRLTWSAPVAVDGFEGARTEFDLPAAPEPPRPVLADSGAVDDAVIAALRREPARDILELVRPHVARGESLTWTIRVDPRALPAVADPRLRPAPETLVPPEPDRVREVVLGSGLVGVALAFGFLVAHKGRSFGAACAACGARAKGLLPVPERLRAALAGAAFAGAIWLQMSDEPTFAGVLVALATLAAALRTPVARPAPRGPGRWLILRPQDAFRDDPRRGHWLDLETRAGRLAATLAAASVAAIALASRHVSPQGPWLVAMDAAAFVPLFATGSAAQLPPDGVRAAASWLAGAFRRLRSIDTLRVAPWAHVALDGSKIDELRLLVLPRIAMPGVVGIEIGLAWSSTPAGWVATPEVLARVLEGSAAAAKLSEDAPNERAMPGRRPEERVVRLVPREVTRASTVAFTRVVSEALTDRRAFIPAQPWTATERRVPRAAPPAVSREATC